MLDSTMDKMKYSSYLVMIIFLLKFNPQLLYSHYLMVLPFTPQLGIWKYSLHLHQIWKHETENKGRVSGKAVIFWKPLITSLTKDILDFSQN